MKITPSDLTYWELLLNELKNPYIYLDAMITTIFVVIMTLVLFKKEPFFVFMVNIMAMVGFSLMYAVLFTLPCTDGNFKITKIYHVNGSAKVTDVTKVSKKEGVGVDNYKKIEFVDKGKAYYVRKPVETNVQKGDKITIRTKNKNVFIDKHHNIMTIDNRKPSPMDVEIH